ncbi:MAG: TetR/AcrR family transcriptional regulator [Anaerolineae bacterium]|nr:TetR/AcrR family transcriptional regulator [Anaerolineae bacterium]
MLDNSTDFKEQMVEARRTQILMGAAQVFADKGFHKATTKEIARKAGVSEGTIYNYFSNKRELLLAMVQMIATQTLRGSFFNNPPDDPKEFLLLLVRDRYRLVDQYGHIFAPLLAEVFSDDELREAVYQSIVMPIAQVVEQYIQKYIELGKFRQVNPVIVTRALIGSMALNTAMKLALVDNRYETISSDDMTEQIVELILDGVLK